MTLTIKDSNEMGGAAKTSAASQTSESKVTAAPRANPVCLEVGVTIRSLPSDQGDINPPMKEEARTVIVFENGAVLRSSRSLPTGQKVILTNERGRDVACRVAPGRNMPSVKGYVELEFMEAVPDFWQIQQGSAPIIAGTPIATEPIASETSKKPISNAPEISRPVSPFQEPAKSVSQESGNAPSFEDIAGLVKMSPSSAKRTANPEVKKPGIASPASAKATSGLNSSDQSTTIAGLHSPNPEISNKRPAGTKPKESFEFDQSPKPQSADFMSKGLLAYAPAKGSSSGSGGRTALVIVAFLILGAAGGGYYLMRQGVISLPWFKVAVANQSVLPDSPQVPSPAQIASERSLSPIQSEPQEAAPSRTAPEEEPQSEPAAVSIPAAHPGAAPVEVRSNQRQSRNQAVSKQPDVAVSPRPVIPNLSLKTPTSPRLKVANQGDDVTPLTDTAASETLSTAPPTGLLSAGSRTSAPPAPASPAPAPVTSAKVMINSKLLSSTRPIYPVAARESKVQGSVVVEASIDEGGSVVAAKALSGPVMLRQAALDSVKQWKYSPATLDGKPVTSQVDVNVEFRLK